MKTYKKLVYLFFSLLLFAFTGCEGCSDSNPTSPENNVSYIRTVV